MNIVLLGFAASFVAGLATGVGAARANMSRSCLFRRMILGSTLIWRLILTLSVAGVLAYGMWMTAPLEIGL
jgi:hypothetical protein